MSKVEVPIPDGTLARVLVIAGAAAILGAATWFGTRPEAASGNESYVDGATGAAVGAYGVQTTPVVYREVAAPQACDPWNVSPVAMEAILHEMVRRGWQPPTQGAALASLQSNGGPSVVALDPNAPVRVGAGQPPPVDPEVVLPPDGELGTEAPTAEVKPPVTTAPKPAPATPRAAPPAPPKITPAAPPRPVPAAPVTPPVAPPEPAAAPPAAATAEPAPN